MDHLITDIKIFQLNGNLKILMEQQKNNYNFNIKINIL